MTDSYDPRRNSAEGYLFGIACLREINIRRRNILPDPGNATEERWAAEGPIAKLETVRAGR